MRWRRNWHKDLSTALELMCVPLHDCTPTLSPQKQQDNFSLHLPKATHSLNKAQTGANHNTIVLRRFLASVRRHKSNNCGTLPRPCDRQKIGFRHLHAETNGILFSNTEDWAQHAQTFLLSISRAQSLDRSLCNLCTVFVQSLHSLCASLNKYLLEATVSHYKGQVHLPVEDNHCSSPLAQHMPSACREVDHCSLQAS